MISSSQPSDPPRRLGVMMMPLENRRQAILHLARSAEAAGIDGLFLPETWAFDITVLLAEIATQTQRLLLGSGVLGVWGRSAGTMAMAAATLDAISDGRFILGLGASTPQLVEGFHDQPFLGTHQKLRRTIEQVRALLAGERIPLGEGNPARPLRLNLPNPPPVPIYLGASADRSIRLAGELCDGWMPFLYPRASLAYGIALLREGKLRAADRSGQGAVCPIIPLIVAEDHGAARQGAAWVVAFYLTKMGDVYRNQLRRAGYAQAVDLVLEAQAAGSNGAVPAEAEVLLEQLTIYGTPAAIPAQLDAWVQQGASLPILMFNPGQSPQTIEFALDALR